MNTLTLLLSSAIAAGAVTQPPADEAFGSILERIDLRTNRGIDSVEGRWTYRDAQLVVAEFPTPGPEGQPTGPVGKTLEVEPRAGTPAFDDRTWDVLREHNIAARHGGGRVSFGWYRLSLTVPAEIDGTKTAGRALTLRVIVDDYAEVWVEGELPRSAGPSSGPMVGGWGFENQVVLTRSAVPGQSIRVAIFAMNGPISDAPSNFIWLKHAELALHSQGSSEPIAVVPHEVNIEVVRKDARIDRLIGPNVKLYKLAEGFQFTEGPVWSSAEKALYFSDPNANRIYKYSDQGTLSIFRRESGYRGKDISEYRQPGSNGLTFAPNGRLTVNQHGNRRIVSLAPDGSERVLVDRFEGKRLNSPNDLVFRRDGALFFTDPFFGLPKFGDDPRRELEFAGVFALTGDKLVVVDRSLAGPNGIAFSPDESNLYVGNWDAKDKSVYRYRRRSDGSYADRTRLVDLTREPGDDAIDGVKVDEHGNLYISGPGGLWIYTSDGQHLGTLIAPRHVHNMAWGDDGSTLYLCARDRLYRLPLRVRGAGLR